MKEWYQMREDEVLEALGSDANGLSSEKAEALLKAHGENVLRETKKKSVWRVFAEQFADLLVIILIIAAIISMISGNVESTIVIFAVITMNAILGTVQHEKAEKSLASLKTLSAPTAKVLRGGVKGEIPSAQVVKGDILLLEAGDMVTADGRILESYSLQVNESSLTGESTNVEKKTVVLEGEKAPDERMVEFQRILERLIMQEMQNYIYNESMYLVQVETSLTHRVKILISGMAVLLLATLGILMRRSFRLTGGIIRPVTEMLDKVKKVGRGNFDVLPVSAEIVEIEELDQGINKMAHRISGLLENVRQEKEMQHLTELQLIQAQVNPHFLYNTLDTIVWLIEGGMTDDAVEMISSLSIFFRTSLSKGNDIIPLSEEKRHTLSYLEIQQFRYRDILEFELSIPKELDGIQVPKLSIQPLAENALYHGIKNRRGKGKITITGREEADAIVLTVSDNGQGMTPERLHEVQEAIRTGERAGFGLAAVAERIALYYGPGYGMTISSKEGEGTTVELRLGKNIQPKS